MCQSSFLRAYTGILQTDGHGGYNQAIEGMNILHVGFFAHAHKYFEKAWKLNKKSKVSYKGLGYILKIYEIKIN